MTHRTMSEHSYHRATSRSLQLTAQVLNFAQGKRRASITQVVEHWLEREITQWDQSDDQSHHEQTPMSYVVAPTTLLNLLLKVS